ncbi:2OG-Fe dioxygenase family protein [Streptomyces sp. NPDC101118]|uniref:2OG-Fe dioxygenase family protein n=1 Tax=Streptomyces sp. NPDC101118 TaxID=3366109 RepID=UPI00382F3F56
MDDTRTLDALAGPGYCLLPPDEVGGRLGADRHRWAEFDRHWDRLVTDPYTEEAGTHRLRRYGHFGMRPGRAAEPRPHGDFLQPEDSNPLYVGRAREFAPLTGEFTADPLLAGLLDLLAEAAAVLADPPEWTVKIHPFRVTATGGRGGEPTPEGVHRDGVTLVSSLLVSRVNAEGGESTVYAPSGAPLLSTVLTEPGTLLLGDDRRTLHGVTAVTPSDPDRPAHRDVLVVTFAAP